MPCCPAPSQRGAPAPKPRRFVDPVNESLKPLSHPRAIQRRFTHSAHSYDDNAALQAIVAENLANLIGQSTPETILEIGCGTGLLTLPLLKKFPESRFTITDSSDQMLARTKAKLSKRAAPPSKDISFKVMDGETRLEKTYDLIAASMVVHWFEDIPAALKRITASLSPNGSFYFSTITAECFPEWQAALAKNNLACGLRLPPPLPGIFHSEKIRITYKTADQFLQNLRRTGADGPRTGYTPLKPHQLKAAMVTLENDHDAAVTWHIQYGRLSVSP